MLLMLQHKKNAIKQKNKASSACSVGLLTTELVVSK